MVNRKENKENKKFLTHSATIAVKSLMSLRGNEFKDDSNHMRTRQNSPMPSGNVAQFKVATEPQHVTVGTRRGKKR